MELSPEERRKIYETEKARLEAEAEIKAEHRQKAVKVGCLGCLGVVVLAIILSAIGSHLPSTSSSSGPALNDPSLLAQAKDVIEQSRQQDVLSEVNYGKDYTEVIVGPNFYVMDFKAKEGICRSISYMARSQGCTGDFMLTDSRTNREAGSFVTGMLNLK